MHQLQQSVRPCFENIGGKEGGRKGGKERRKEGGRRREGGRKDVGWMDGWMGVSYTSALAQPSLWVAV